MEWLKVNTFAEVIIEVPFASSWKRYFAFFLDTCFKICWGFAVYTLYQEDILPTLLAFFLLIPLFLYSLLWEYFGKGVSPGKWTVRIKVIGEEGAPPSFSQCFVRWVFLFLDAYSTLLLYFVSPWTLILVAFGPAVAVARIERFHQRYGDLAAGTYVVDSDPDYPKVEDTIYSFSNSSDQLEVRYPEVMRFSDRDMTRVKEVLDGKDQEMQARLSAKIQELLEVKKQEDDEGFLRQLLRDYNKLSV